MVRKEECSKCHKQVQKKKLRRVSESDAIHYQELYGVGPGPGSRVCKRCHAKKTNTLVKQSETTTISTVSVQNTLRHLSSAKTFGPTRP